MFSLTHSFVGWNTLNKDDASRNQYEQRYINQDKVLFFTFNNIKKNSVKLKDLKTINLLMITYNMLSFLNTNSYSDILLKTNDDINRKNLIYRDFMTYIQVKNWKIKNDFELISDKIEYKFDLDMKYKYKFNLYSKGTIGKSLLYGYLNYIFIIGEDSNSFDQDAGYHQNYSMSDFRGNLYDFLIKYIDNVISKSEYLLKSDSLGDILLSIHELVYSYLEDIDKIGLEFYYPINMDSIASYYEDDYYEDDYDEDEEYISIDSHVNSDLNFVLERDVKDFIFYYDSDVYVTVYKNDADAYDGSPIGFSLNVAKHKQILKIRLVISFYLDSTYDEFYIKESYEKPNEKRTKKITAKNNEEGITKHNISYYKEIDLSDISNKKYINIINEINNHIDNILDGKILIGINNNIVL